MLEEVCPSPPPSHPLSTQGDQSHQPRHSQCPFCTPSAQGSTHRSFLLLPSQMRFARSPNLSRAPHQSTQLSRILYTALHFLFYCDKMHIPKLPILTVFQCTVALCPHCCAVVSTFISGTFRLPELRLSPSSNYPTLLPSPRHPLCFLFLQV